MSIGVWYSRNGNWYNTRRAGVIKTGNSEKFEVFDSRLDFINNAAATVVESLEEAKDHIQSNPS